MVFTPPDFSEVSIEGHPVTSAVQRERIFQSWRLVSASVETDRHPWVGLTISDMFFETFDRLHPAAVVLQR